MQFDQLFILDLQASLLGKFANKRGTWPFAAIDTSTKKIPRTSLVDRGGALAEKKSLRCHAINNGPCACRNDAFFQDAFCHDFADARMNKWVTSYRRLKG